ncbi:Uncharacterised protein [Pseudomonas fluorescens]|uniref:Uncharacterized protein n=1 Tax=Pseudomonas fluorescens TaxID=294 RepID=A0A379I8C4_PSEFL|nr:Uncharacterised protein [Pseudomonas fluorescens]
MSYTVCYTIDNKRIVTRLQVENLTPYAAVAYALLESGMVEGEPHTWPPSYEGLVEAARKIGLTDVCFHRTLGKKR